MYIIISLFILIDYPVHIDTISMEESIYMGVGSKFIKPWTSEIQIWASALDFQQCGI